MKEEDKRLQEVLDKARRFTKKLLDDEDYRPPNDEIKRFKNEDAVRDSELKMSLNVTWSRRWRLRDRAAAAPSTRPHESLRASRRNLSLIHI